MTHMQKIEHGPPLQALLLGFTGCAALGATVGIDSGTFAVLHDAISLPASVALVTAVLVPALYIAVSLSGVEITIPRLLRAVTAGIRASGVAALGLIAPVLFLLASTSNTDVAFILASLTLCVVACLGLRAMYLSLFEATGTQSLVNIYLFWSLVFLGIGAKVTLGNLVL